MEECNRLLGFQSGELFKILHRVNNALSDNEFVKQMLNMNKDINNMADNNWELMPSTIKKYVTFLLIRFVLFFFVQFLFLTDLLIAKSFYITLFYLIYLLYTFYNVLFVDTV